jgi:hypothetical protein
MAHLQTHDPSRQHSHYYYVYNYVERGSGCRLELCATEYTSTGMCRPVTFTIESIPDMFCVYPIRDLEAATHVAEAAGAEFRAIRMLSNAAHPVAYAPVSGPTTSNDTEWALIIHDREHRDGGVSDIPYNIRVDQAQTERTRLGQMVSKLGGFPGTSPIVHGPDPSAAWSFRHACQDRGILEAAVFPCWISMSRDIQDGSVMNIGTYIAEARPVSAGTEETLKWLPLIPPLRITYVDSTDGGSLSSVSHHWSVSYTNGVDPGALPNKVAPIYSRLAVPSDEYGGARTDIVVWRRPHGTYHGYSHEEERATQHTDGLRKLDAFVRNNRRLFERGAKLSERLRYNMVVIVDTRAGGGNPQVCMDKLQFALFKARTSGLAWESMALSDDASLGTVVALCDSTLALALYRGGYTILPGIRPSAASTQGSGRAYAAGRSELYVPPGVYTEGNILDVKSYYPNIVRELQTCITNPRFWPKTHPVTGAYIPYDDLPLYKAEMVDPTCTAVLESTSGNVNSRASRYDHSNLHPIPRLMDAMLTLRASADRSHPIFAAAMKLMANEIYGTWGYKKSRLGGWPLAVAIGTAGKQWIEELAASVKNISETKCPAGEQVSVDMIITDSLLLRGSHANIKATLDDFLPYLSKRFRYIKVSQTPYLASIIHAKGCYALYHEGGNVTVRGYTQRDFCEAAASCIHDVIRAVLQCRSLSTEPSFAVQALATVRILLSACDSEGRLMRDSPTPADFERSGNRYTFSISTGNAQRLKLTIPSEYQARLAEESTVAGRLQGVAVVDQQLSRSRDQTDQLQLVPYAAWRDSPERYRLAWSEWYVARTLYPVICNKILCHLPGADVAEIGRELGWAAHVESTRPRQRILDRVSPGESPSSVFNEPEITVTCYACKEPVRIDPLWRSASGPLECSVSADITDAGLSASINLVKCGSCGALLSDAPRADRRVTVHTAARETMDRSAMHAEFGLLLDDHRHLTHACDSMPHGAAGFERLTLREIETKITGSPYNTFAW